MTNRTDGLDAAGVAELLPCPFCGGTFVAQGASRDYISVWCDCGARGPEVKFPEHCDPLPPIDECRALWNRRSALVDAPAGEMVCPHNCEVGGICLAEHSGYPKSCPVKASSTPSVAALQAEIDRLRKAVTRQGDNLAFLLNHATVPEQWAEKFDRELEEDRAIARAVAALPPDTEGEAQPVAVTESCGCVFRDLDVPCRNPECKICHDLPAVSEAMLLSDAVVHQVGDVVANAFNDETHAGWLSAHTRVEIARAVLKKIAALASVPGKGWQLVERADLQFCIDAIAKLHEQKARLRLEQMLAASSPEDGR